MHLGIGKKKVRAAGSDLVLDVTGQQVGGVAPVGHRHAITTPIDRDLSDHEVIRAGAGDEHSMFATTTDELVEITGGTVLQLADEEPTPSTA